MTYDVQVYNPRDSRFKRPYGAVSAGTVLRFTLRPERARGFSHGILTARFESRDNEEERIFLPWMDMEEGRDVFAGTLPTGDYVGLIWYSFKLEGLDGRSLELGEYQLTVYDGREEVAAWFGQGVTYQIFPDRFRRTAPPPDPAGMPGDRWIHRGWEEEPEYRPDERGEVRNRDFFGGSIAGVREKLGYLRELGVETIYFCPIFEAGENHRYGTGDYEKVDPLFGTNGEFEALCAEAHAMGMRVMLDGVFNHQGFVSKYFNGDGSYPCPTPGAHQSMDSPWYKWYNFQRWPDRYDAWWGIYTLPAVNESEPSYLDYVIRGEDSIVRRWLRAGADGWRLDVADELPDSFVCALHAAVRETKPDGVVIGEVWEDGSTKVAYGVRRKHILGGHCDGLMNYPFRNACISYLLGGDAGQFMEEMERLRENYPRWAYYSAMNALGTHDTPRILTLLGTGSACTEYTKAWRADHRLTPEQRARALSLLKLGALILFAFPGSPTVYYGDEAGMEGFEDPFNRRTFPWGREDRALTAWYAALGRLRNTQSALRDGDISYLAAEGRVLAFTRTLGEQAVAAAVNAGPEPAELRLPWSAVDLLEEGAYPLGEEGEVVVTLPPYSGKLLVRAPYLS